MRSSRWSEALACLLVAAVALGGCSGESGEPGADSRLDTDADSGAPIDVVADGVLGEGVDSVVSEVVDDGAVGEVMADSAISEVVEDTTVSDVMEDSAIGEVMEDTTVSDVMEDIAIGEVMEDTTVSEVMEDIGIGEVTEDTAVGEVFDTSVGDVADTAVSEVVDTNVNEVADTNDTNVNEVADTNVHEVADTNDTEVADTNDTNLGEVADTNVDDCVPNPCLNGGTCQDGDATFTCTCAAGFDGPTCAHDIDDCASNPCSNGGTCSDAVNGFNCTCATGWEGPTCETNIDDCTPNPCSNGGTCVDAVASFSCNCASGWTGATCAQYDCVARDGCDDGLPCTQDTCDPDAGCSNVVMCDDGNACTHDSCVPGVGCVHSATGAACADDNACLETRCAAPTVSASSCADLAWGGPGGTAEVCAATTIAGACPTLMVHADAQARCEGAGGRLCSAAELLAGEGNMTGCGISNTYTWSDTPCFGGRVAVREASHQSQCRPEDTTLTARCCADADPAAIAPACVLVAATDCDDGDPCTIDGCDPATGCYHTSDACDDGDPCTVDACDDSSGACSYDPLCLNGASCETDGVEVYCGCATDWGGALCDQPVDDCVPNPCNGGTCTDLVGDYACVCRPGYEGKSCSVDIDDCVGNKCTNGSKCVDYVNNYECRCQEGTYGPFCRVSDCAVRKCDDGNPCTVDSCDPVLGCIVSAGETCPWPQVYDGFLGTEHVLVLAGSATFSDGVLVVSPALANAKGAAWLFDKQHVADGFSASFTAELVGPYYAGEGLAFVIQNNGKSQNPGHLGPATNALVITLDANKNAGEAGHQGLFITLSGTRISSTDLGGDWSNRGKVTVDVALDTSTLTVSVDGEQRAQVLVDLETAGVYDGDGKAWVGFAATTGAGNKLEAHDVHRLRFQEGNCSRTCTLPSGCGEGQCRDAVVSDVSCTSIASNAETWGSPAVCGRSLTPLCPVTGWADAAERCSQLGWRLCTASELKADEARDTGCGLDDATVWSADRCAPSKHWAVDGATNSIAPGGDQCRADDEATAVRCCADDLTMARLPVCASEIGEDCRDIDSCTIDLCAWGFGCDQAPPAQCDEAGDGDCCAGNATAGCAERNCQTCVCDLAPECCSGAWDEACAALARDEPACAWSCLTCRVCEPGTQDNDIDGICRSSCAMTDCPALATCDDKSGEALCVCRAGYTGANCDVCAAGYAENQAGACLKTCSGPSSMECNSGSCASQDGGATWGCVCPNGYAGDCTQCAVPEFVGSGGDCFPSCASVTCADKPMLSCDDSSGVPLVVCGECGKHSHCPADAYCLDNSCTARFPLDAGCSIDAECLSEHCVGDLAAGRMILDPAALSVGLDLSHEAVGHLLHSQDGAAGAPVLPARRPRVVVVRRTCRRRSG